jgi:hypothetical protein
METLGRFTTYLENGKLVGLQIHRGRVCATDVYSSRFRYDSAPAFIASTTLARVACYPHAICSPLLTIWLGWPGLQRPAGLSN